MAAFGLGIPAQRRRIEKVLKERGAFDENRKVDPKEAGIDYKRTIDLMEKGGLIARTRDGKIYLTPKGQRKCLS